MSDSQAYEEVNVASDGVLVTKRYEADEFPVPAIAFNFQSDRSEPVTVKLSDHVPDDVAVEDLGFHPEYGSEYWTIDDDEISFEREIEPDSEYTTVYGIRATGTDNVEQFLTEPTIEEVDPPLEDDEEALVGEGSDAVKDVISGESDSVPGLDDVDDEDIETLDLKDPSEEGGESEESEAEGDEESGGGGGIAVAGDTLVEALANDLRNNNVSKEDVQLLRKAFDLASENDGSVKAKVDQIQDDVNDLRAYTAALEEFLDENGTADQMFGEFQEELESFRSRIDGFGEDVEALKETTSANQEEVASMADEFAGVQETVSDVEGTVDDVEARVEDLDERIEGLEGEIEDVREELTDGDVDERFDEIHDEIEELKEWREQLSSVIGGGEG